MISLIAEVPACKTFDPELIKIRSAFEQYSDIALFWRQNEGDCYISLLDNNMVIYNTSADVSELKGFIGLISPSSIFTDSLTLSLLELEPSETALIMLKNCDNDSADLSDELSSADVYELFNTEGLDMPDYPHFAVDFCHRKNHGGLKAFGFKGISAAAAIITGDYALVTGVASRKKGYGSKTLGGLTASLKGKTAVACCREEIKEFYIKNGFTGLDKKCVYWVRK